MRELSSSLCALAALGAGVAGLWLLVAALIARVSERAPGMVPPTLARRKVRQLRAQAATLVGLAVLLVAVSQLLRLSAFG